MARWSYAEYLVRLRWLDEQWNKPDRRSYEIAQAAAGIVRVQLKAEDQSKIKTEDFLPKFNLVRPEDKQEAKPLPPLQLMKLPSDHPLVVQAKMRWNAFLKPPRRKRP